MPPYLPYNGGQDSGTKIEINLKLVIDVSEKMQNIGRFDEKEYVYRLFL